VGGEAAVEVARFCAQRDHYWANALDCAARKELRKASELAWGAVAQALKALAASAALHLGTHRQLADFARDLNQRWHTNALTPLLPAAGQQRRYGVRGRAGRRSSGAGLPASAGRDSLGAGLRFSPVGNTGPTATGATSRIRPTGGAPVFPAHPRP
jgi:hypothetical protein